MKSENKTKAFATKIPDALLKKLDRVCEETGLRKNYVVETALAEKLEDLLDACDLREAMEEATGFHSWQSVRTAWQRGKRP